MGNDPANLTDEDGGCAGCKISATASKQVAGVGYNSVVTFKRVTSTTVSFSKVMAEANTALNVVDGSLKTLKRVKSKDEIINQGVDFQGPQPAKSFVNPPNVETINNYPLAAAAQWATNFLWEASGAKEAEINIKNRISGYKEGGIIDDAKAIFDAGTIISRPGKPGKVGRPETPSLKSNTPKNGSTPANRRGMELHKEYKKFEHDPENGRFKEYTGLLKDYGIKPDFVDFNTKTIYDLKPNNPQKTTTHLKQVEKYKTIFEKEFGGKWNIVIDHYQ